MYDVVALGELLVDFTPCGVSAQELPVYQANPGGAPCNVLSMLSRLGRRTALTIRGWSLPGKSTPPWPSSRLTNMATVIFPSTAIPART